MGKKILGLDLGTNSIGWALIERDFENNEGKILGMGSRIIPMGQDELGEFEKGNSVSKTAERTRLRSARRLRERYLLRRERLHRVLKVLGFLPDHYANEIDFEERLGKFKNEAEPKIPWKKNDNGDNEFIFKNSFNQMLAEFNAVGHSQKIPYDWTIYYLRKKALKKSITKEELAWLLLHFNQKRGYFQLRGEEENDAKESVKEFIERLKVIQVEKSNVDAKNEKKIWYRITLENGWEFSAAFTTEPQWAGLEKDFLITEEYDESGNIKIIKDSRKDSSGREKRTISPLPSFDEIDLMSKKEQDRFYKKIKVRTELSIKNSNKTVGEFIYENLLLNPHQKIRGKLVRTIDRKFYKNELNAILKKQIELQPELFTEELYSNCVRELYRKNESHQTQLQGKGFIHLFVEDIIFFQRPLKSKKSTISDCSLEYRLYKTVDNDGKEAWKKKSLKALPVSHPLFQEFRIWQWIDNLKIYRREDETDVTKEFLTSRNDYENLFEFLASQKSINQEQLLEYFIVPRLRTSYPDAKPKILKGELKKENAKYRWNYIYDEEKNESKTYPMNETGFEIRSRLKKAGISLEFLSPEKETRLWHIIYSVTDIAQFRSALQTFADKNNIDEGAFVSAFLKVPPFNREYRSYSLKAIKKLLSLMRIGRYWNWSEIDDKTKIRIQKILTGEVDEKIKEKVRNHVERYQLRSENDFQGLPLWLAQYIIYNRHSESGEHIKWKSPDDISWFLNVGNPEGFKQHSLRNPIVEQVVTETLRVVEDIWKYFGKCQENFFDEIHIELGREMKNTAEERKRITSQLTENENTNSRIKAMLLEFSDDNYFKNDKDYKDEKGETPEYFKKGNNPVRPFSLMQHEKLKIYEEGVLSRYSDQELKSELAHIKEGNREITIFDISRNAKPSKSEIIRYRLWLEQKYRSPYTGQPIPLNKLFSPEYEIEHVIPQSRFFDNSLSNKVICESSINKLKDKQLGLEFIQNHGGEIVQDGNKRFRVLNELEYRDFVNQSYGNNSMKRKKLLMDEIPDIMIERQINDTRYISRYISSLLSNIIREEQGDDGVNSKSLISVNGKITSVLRQEWGLNDVWNELILPRFQRMNELTQSNTFTTVNKQGHIIPTMPADLAKGFQKKRIDHRHHALDALVIACTTRDHVQYLNNKHARSQKHNLQIGLGKKIRATKTILKDKWVRLGDTWQKTGEKETKVVLDNYLKPWDRFTEETRNKLENVVPSFKQNLRIINKSTNKDEKVVNKSGRLVKQLTRQKNDDNWAIRKPMHKDTVSGKVVLPWYKIPKGKILTATRKPLNTGFDLKVIGSITDTGIQKILKNFLLSKNNNPEIAFTPEGIEELNKKIPQFNDGKPHQPIYKVRVFETGSKFSVGSIGNKKKKFVEAAKGTNLFFAIYEDSNGKRNYNTIPLNIVIERLKQGLNPVPENDEKGNKLLFHLSPNDLVYLPTEDELHIDSPLTFPKITGDKINRIYRFTDGSGIMANFSPVNIAEVIFNLNKEKQKKSGVNFPIQNEIGIGSQGSKNERALTGEQIKAICRKLYIDRLGNITLQRT